MKWIDRFEAAMEVVRAKGCLWRCNSVGDWPRAQMRACISNGGEMEIGDRVRFFGRTVRSDLVTYPGGRIEIGNRVFINYGTSISAHKLVKIGDHCIIGSYANLMDNDYHQIEPENRLKLGPSEPIILERNVWLGVRVVILKGVHIGENSVVGACSLVTRDIPANCLAAGQPARVIRTFDVSP